ncbi:amidase [Oleiharenicola lentus]|uniref:Amidase n=1 Tax=Oleiharenicola lentus TaxID=2508720 RepID=A0A4V1M6J5_9BACT|nr:amidase [Oleiharenicola lentus]RXK55619.1 amidase [Oleiharenicola lentus]
MDTNASKTPDPLPLAAWQNLSPDAAAREVHARVAALPDHLRRAAVAWLKPEPDLAHEFSTGGSVSAPTATDTAARPRPLRGIPYLLKDLFDLAGVPTRAGSTFLDQVRPAPKTDSRIVQRLGELGAVCAGKTHLVEFASGLTGENPHYGDCPHPRFPNRLSGGSSSGSAALVAAGVAPLSIGTDTGGSVRVPAAWCGLHGFRLSPGDEFIRDAFPLAPTLDTAGWFTASAGDMLAVWQAWTGSRVGAKATTGSSTLSSRPAGTQARLPDTPPRGCYLNARKLVPGMDPAVATACDYAAASLSAHADPVAEAALSLSWNHAVESYITIGMSEAHAVHRHWLAPYREHYDPVIWKRFTDAGHFPAADIARARERLAEVRSVFRDFFRAYDYLVLPAVPCVAPTKTEANLELRRNILTLTAPASLAGLPVLTIPVPLNSGLTAGLQIILPSADSPAVPWLLSR